MLQYHLTILLFLSLLSACTLTSASSRDSGTTLSSCELMHSAHPHPKAVAALGSNRLKQVQSLNVEETADFSRAFFTMTLEMSKYVVGASEDSLEIVGQDLVLGGYAGQSTNTAVIRTRVKNAAGYKALLRLAAHIGYVYAQDSTLVICEGQAVSDWRSVISLEISDAGKEEFLNEENAIRLYGLIVGAFNGPDNIGYTYYPDSKVFSTLAGLSRGEQGRLIVIELANWVSSLSNGDVQFDFTTRPVWIFYPHNDWEAQPAGGTYTVHMMDQKLNPVLTQRRKQYLQTFDAFFKDPLVGN